jgi:hypothetical protein
MREVNRYKTEADTKSGKPIVNPDYTLTRPKRLRKFEKVDGVKVVNGALQEPEKKELFIPIRLRGFVADRRRNGGARRVGIK